MTWVERLCAIHENSWRPAVIDESGIVTGREFIGKAVHAAELLASLDVVAGQPVPALITTNADALAMLVGGAAANRPLAPLGPRQTVPELASMVRRTGSTVLLSEASFVDTAAEVADAVGIRVLPIPALQASSRPLHRETSAAAVYLHTAGTTGEPKRIPLTEHVLRARAELLCDITGLGPDGRYATGSPLHHIGGLGNVQAALMGGAAVICTTKFSFDWWRSLKTLDATHCLLVPTMIEMLLQRGLLDAVPLQSLIYGASPITVGTLRRVLDLLPEVDVVSLYGQTEGSPITSLSAADHRRAAAEDPDLLRTVGRPVKGLRLRVDGPDVAGVGEVFAAADHLAAPSADGWLHTGDLGTIDDGGYLRLCGRRHDMVIRGGENVYPVEVENALSSHPGVAAAGVVGVPDARLGETLAAFIVAADPARPPSPEELRPFCRSALAGYKVPKYWYSIAELPLNGAGKVLRTTLRATHAEHDANDGRMDLT
jgi:acyl-CoA synthetase (AMP-forming)/AMP-acid ligase II